MVTEFNVVNPFNLFNFFDGSPGTGSKEFVAELIFILVIAAVFILILAFEVVFVLKAVGEGERFFAGIVAPFGDGGESGAPDLEVAAGADVRTL
jgi:hypothetical protein